MWKVISNHVLIAFGDPFWLEFWGWSLNAPIRKPTRLILSSWRIYWCLPQAEVKSPKATLSWSSSASHILWRWQNSKDRMVWKEGKTRALSSMIVSFSSFHLVWKVGREQWGLESDSMRLKQFQPYLPLLWSRKGINWPQPQFLHTEEYCATSWYWIR